MRRTTLLPSLLVIHCASLIQASSKPLGSATWGVKACVQNRRHNGSFRRGGGSDFCFVHRRRTHTTSLGDETIARYNSPLLFVSRSSSANGRTKRTNDRPNESGARSEAESSPTAGGVDKGRRMKKTELDDLLRGIGLEPVAQSTSSTKKKHEAASIDAVDYSQNQHQNDESFSIMEGQPEISLQTQLDYSRRGHAVLRSFLPETLVRRLRSELVPYAASHALSGWRQKVEVQLADGPDEHRRKNAPSIADGLESIEECEAFLESLGIDPSSGDLPFLQHFNAWRAPDAANIVPTVRGLCLSPYLARAASILLDVPTVRLYQDSLFHKRAGDGWTPWHSDARMAPFDTSRMISFWIPLQRIPSPEDGGTGLLFVDGSHSDMALPYWNGADGDEHGRLEDRYGGDDGVGHHMPLELGSVTVHNGWTLHCADAPDDDEDCEDRYALSITYVDGRAELREDVLSSPPRADDATTAKDDKEDVWSFRSWVIEVEPRTQFRHPMAPIVWPKNERDVR